MRTEALRVFDDITVSETLYQQELDSFKSLRFSDDNGAIFSYDLYHRYILWRRWDRQLLSLVFMGINASLAGIETDDAIVRRCKAYAKSKGYGGIIIINLFSLISKSPRELVKYQPVLLNTPNSNYWVEFIAKSFTNIVFMWGNNGELFPDRVKEVTELFKMNNCKPLCLGKTSSGNPRHVITLTVETKLELWQ